ncbi:hypothetical protein EI94DRAFT_1701560 [Lactarius quietus]|nr:hypothetical protein EI94DRAFT_1701560 [Lactarius quietus]
MLPCARQQIPTAEQALVTPLAAPPADALTRSVKSRNGKSSNAHKKLPRLVLRRPRAAAATTQGMSTCHLKSPWESSPSLRRKQQCQMPRRGHQRCSENLQSSTGIGPPYLELTNDEDKSNLSLSGQVGSVPAGRVRKLRQVPVMFVLPNEPTMLLSHLPPPAETLLKAKLSSSDDSTMVTENGGTDSVSSEDEEADDLVRLTQNVRLSQKMATKRPFWPAGAGDAMDVDQDSIAQHCIVSDHKSSTSVRSKAQQAPHAHFKAHHQVAAPDSESRQVMHEDFKTLCESGFTGTISQCKYVQSEDCQGKPGYLEGHQVTQTFSNGPQVTESEFTEIKEQCIAAVMLAVDTQSLPAVIASIIEKQLNNFNYIFPRQTKGNILIGSPLCSRPYRSSVILSVIRDKFFSGADSFVTKHRDSFPSHLGPDGEAIPEVPKAMLALVSTAYYAALYEWRTGGGVQGRDGGVGHREEGCREEGHREEMGGGAQGGDGGRGTGRRWGEGHREEMGGGAQGGDGGRGTGRRWGEGCREEGHREEGHREERHREEGCREEMEGGGHREETGGGGAQGGDRGGGAQGGDWGGGAQGGDWGGGAQGGDREEGCREEGHRKEMEGGAQGGDWGGGVQGGDREEWHGKEMEGGGTGRRPGGRGTGRRQGGGVQEGEEGGGTGRRLGGRGPGRRQGEGHREEGGREEMEGGGTGRRPGGRGTGRRWGGGAQGGGAQEGDRGGGHREETRGEGRRDIGKNLSH